MGYTGNATIEKMRSNCNFVKITNSGLRESHAHSINITQSAELFYRKLKNALLLTKRFYLYSKTKTCFNLSTPEVKASFDSLIDFSSKLKPSSLLTR